MVVVDVIAKEHLNISVAIEPMDIAIEPMKIAKAQLWILQN